MILDNHTVVFKSADDAAGTINVKTKSVYVQYVKPGWDPTQEETVYADGELQGSGHSRRVYRIICYPFSQNPNSDIQTYGDMEELIAVIDDPERYIWIESTTLRRWVNFTSDDYPLANFPSFPLLVSLSGDIQTDTIGDRDECEFMVKERYFNG